MPARETRSAIETPHLADVSRETRDRLQMLVETLLRWQPRMNLIAPATIPSIWTRHIADSLQLASLIHDDTRPLIDLGSGAGFPGLVLAIARLDTGSPHHLVESNSRKCAFLREAARACGVDRIVIVHDGRIEDVVPHLPAPSVVTARALAPLADLLDLAAPLLEGGSRAVFHKGRDHEAELATAQRRWHLDLTIHPSKIEPGAALLDIRAARPRS